MVLTIVGDDEWMALLRIRVLLAFASDFASVKLLIESGTQEGRKPVAKGGPSEHAARA